MTGGSSVALPTEHQEQSALVQWFCAQYPRHKRLLFAIPNGAWLAGGIKQRAQQMSRLRREGLHAGVPDLFLALPRGAWHGMFIEMKRRRGGTISPEQRAYCGLLHEQGYNVVVCFGFEAAREAVLEYMSEDQASGG